MKYLLWSILALTQVPFMVYDSSYWWNFIVFGFICGIIFRSILEGGE